MPTPAMPSYEQWRWPSTANARPWQPAVLACTGPATHQRPLPQPWRGLAPRDVDVRVTTKGRTYTTAWA
jgi:hypothetical protein